MKKISKHLSSFLAILQLSSSLSNSFAISTKNTETQSSRAEQCTHYLKKAAILPLKGAWWITKAHLKAFGVLTADAIILSSIGIYRLRQSPKIIFNKLKEQNNIPENFNEEIYKNHLKEFESLLDKGYDENAAIKATIFFNTHFLHQQITLELDESILKLLNLDKFIYTHEEQAHSYSGDLSESDSEYMTYFVLGSYGVSISEEIDCLKRCMQKIRKNMQLNGTNFIDSSNPWADLLGNVTNRKKFLEGCKQF